MANHDARPEEPCVFRRCYLACLDWWGDAGAAYVRCSHTKIPTSPDAVFEDCSLVSPDNALEVGYPNFPGYTRVKFTKCRLIVLNFSQPGGTPSGGIIHTPLDGKQLHVDLEDCRMMGYKVFSTEGKSPIRYTVQGKVQAYVQFQQRVPAGIERLTSWPVDLFQHVAPRRRPPVEAGHDPAKNHTLVGGTRVDRVLRRGPSDASESTRGKETHETAGEAGNKRDGIHAACVQRAAADVSQPADRRAETRPESDVPVPCGPPDGQGTDTVRASRHSLGSAFVRGDEIHVFAADHTENDWFHDIYHFRSTDLKTWTRELAIRREGSEHLLNSSVCQDEQGFLMAYESNQPVAFCFKFARSKDLAAWQKVPGLVFTGEKNEYGACPVIRCFKPYYYVIYLHAAIPGHNGWVSFLARSKDLATWQLSPRNPILEAGEGEGCNNSDVDLIEIDGKTYVTIAPATSRHGAI